MALVNGEATEKFAPLRAVLEQHLDSGEDIGAAVAVYLRGDLVADLWGGHLDEARTRPWERDTIANVWSVTKTMTFLVSLMLADRGELDFNARVSDYWPEFAQAGKSQIEVRHILGHTSGLPYWTEPLAPEDLADWDLCTSLLAAQEPIWTPGTASGYHLVTQGYLIGEIVRRITGVSFGTYFRTEVADVIGADFHVGLPESEESRVGYPIPADGDILDGVDPGSITYRAWNSPPVDFTWPQHRWWRAAEIPSSNGHGNARSTAKIQSIVANRGEFEGHRFFSERTGDLIFETQAQGVDLVLGIEAHFGMGYGLATSLVPLGPHTAYWAGLGSLVIIDQDLGLTVAYTPNKMQIVPGSTKGATITRVALESVFR